MLSELTKRCGRNAGLGGHVAHLNSNEERRVLEGGYFVIVSVYACANSVNSLRDGDSRSTVSGETYGVFGGKRSLAPRSVL